MSSSSSSAIGGFTPAYTYPLINPKKEEDEKKDWVWITAIVITVIGALIAALAVVCSMGIFPPELLGGPLLAGITFFVGAAIAAGAGLVLLDRWLDPPSP